MRKIRGHFKMLWSLVLVPLCMMLLLMSSARAQETTGTIQGTIKDPTGAVIPGATVEVSAPTLIGTKKMETDEVGYYRFTNLPPGDYTIVVTATGFRQERQTGVRLEVGKLLTIDLTLQVGALEQTIEVVASPLIIDVTQSKAAVNISTDIITYIPKGRSFQDMINFAPGARYEPMQQGYQIDGASDGENLYLVEGMDTTHIQTGRSGVNVLLDTVQEVQVKSSGFEAEYGGALGGVVNVIAKRGGNTWHGSGLMYYRSNGLEALPRPGLRLNPADRLDRTKRLAERPEYYQYKPDSWRTVEPGFDFGGYIVKDRLWIYGSYIPELHRSEREVYFTYPGKVGPRNFLYTSSTHYASGRLDWRPVDAIRTNFSWNYAYNRWRGERPGQDSLYGQYNAASTVDPASYRQEYGAINPNSTYVLSSDFTISPKMIVTARFGFWNTNTQDRGRPSGIRYYYSRSAIGGVALDGTPIPTALQQPSGFQNMGDIRQTVFDIRQRHMFGVDASYLVRGAGHHNFKGGYAFNRLANNVDYEPFTGWVQLHWGRDYSPILAAGVQTCAQLKAENKAKYGKEVCSGLYGVYRIIDFSTMGNVSSFNHSLYIQDAWSVVRGVTLNLGVRFDKEYLPSFATGKNIPSKAIEFGFTDKVAPRLGGAWDVLGNGKLKLFGSWGFFYDIMKYEMPRGSFGGDYWHDCYYTLDDPDYTKIVPRKDANGHTCPGLPTPGRKIEEIDWRIPSNDPENYTIDPNLKPMRQREMVFGAEYALASNLGLEIRYARKRLDRTIEDVGTLDPEFGERYFIANPGFGVAEYPLKRECPTCPPSPKAIRNYDGLEFRLTRRWARNFFFSASYTYSRDYGNYSGLTSTDESGRHSPNVNRFFDLPNMNYDSHGQVAKGVLPTDRPHTFKFYGAYRLKWAGESTFGLNFFAYSGTPVTTEVNIISSTPVQVENRGNFIPITRDPATGNLVAGAVKKGFRVDAFTNSDFMFVHEFKLSKTNEALRAAFEVNISNLFNEKNVIRIDNAVLRENQISFADPVTGHDRWEDFFKGFNWVAMANAQNLILSSTYGLPNWFNAPRAVRLKLKFSF